MTSTRITIIELPEAPTTTAAYLKIEEPKQINKGKRRLMENYTNYWDLDYRARNEVDSLYQEKSNPRQ